MPFKFTNQPLQQGLYEPEGIYLHPPYAGVGVVLQPFGVPHQGHEQLTYNGVPLKGHTGIDFGVSPATALLAVDDGRVIEISYDPGGLGRYIKLAHRWGESLSALVSDVTVDSGRHVKQGETLGRAGSESVGSSSWAVLHFGVRIQPFNRFDGWGGYANPILFFSVEDLHYPAPDYLENLPSPLHRLNEEEQRMRRP